MAESKSVQATFKIERETKNMVRYEETQGRVVCGTIYITKAAYTQLNNPEEITVTIKAK